jgi:antitoxin PrlF
MLEVESTLTDRYQTTVPEPVRRILNLAKRDRLHYAIQSDGSVVITRASSSSEDSALEPFLDLLAREIAEHPEHLAPVPAALRARIDALVIDVPVDLDAALSDDGE